MRDKGEEWFSSLSIVWCASSALKGVSGGRRSELGSRVSRGDRGVGREVAVQGEKVAEREGSAERSCRAKWQGGALVIC